MNNELTFYFEDLPVGYFEEEAYPSSHGRYKYMPFRDPGHYNLQVALKSSSGQLCYYRHDGNIHYFKVVGCPQYGYLDLIEFSMPKKESS